MGGSIDVLGGGVGGCTAMVGNVVGTVALRQEPKGEVRRTPIVADHCVAGRSGVLVGVAGDVDGRVLALVIVDIGALVCMLLLCTVLSVANSRLKGCRSSGPERNINTVILVDVDESMLDLPWLLVAGEFRRPGKLRGAGLRRLDRRVIRRGSPRRFTVRWCAFLVIVGVSLDAGLLVMCTRSLRDRSTLFVQVGKRSPIKVVYTFSVVGVFTVAVDGEDLTS